MLKEIEFIEQKLKVTAELSEIVQHSGSIKGEVKSDKSDVTFADIANQVVFNLAIKKHFPADRIIAEESDISQYSEELLSSAHQFLSENKVFAGSLDDFKDVLSYRGPQDAELIWTIDPIDGTNEFINHKCFAEMICHLNNKGELLASGATVHHPNSIIKDFTHEPIMFLAEKGRGVSINKGQIPVDTKPKKRKPRILMPKNRIDSKFGKKILKALDLKKEDITLIYSTSKLSLLATGEFDAYIHFPIKKNWYLNLWDIATPALIATEAGSIVTDLEGHPLNYSTGAKLVDNVSGVLATNNQELHDKIISLWLESN